MKKLNSARARRLSAFFFLPSTFLIFLVRLYRVTLSPAKAYLFGPSAQCRFQPSCSQYTIDALKTHGALSGGWLAAKRVCRCHPWGECGEDPVPPLKSTVQSPSSQVRHFGFRTSSFRFRT